LYSNYSDPEFRTKTGVGWTTDTRDWLNEESASEWAQKTYAKKYKKFLPVDNKTAKLFKSYIKTLPENDELRILLDEKEQIIFDKKIHEPIKGWHGPSQKYIEEKILNDRGVNGACVPLTHFGGHNTLKALKSVIKKLKFLKKEFRMLDDHLDITKAVRVLAEPEKLSPDLGLRCEDPVTEKNYIIVKSEDTLWGISKRTGLSVGKIKEFNNLIEDEIDLGQKIYLEPLVTFHIVQRGDTLYSLSKMYDLSIKSIQAVNNLISEEIVPGQKLTMRKN
jgi:LysM repeat protein